MRKGRGIDHSWKVCKYFGDAAFYARCKCGWYYACGDTMDRREPEKWILYHYCPSCGAHKKWYNNEVIRLTKYFPWE